MSIPTTIKGYHYSIVTEILPIITRVSLTDKVSLNLMSSEVKVQKSKLQIIYSNQHQQLSTISFNTKIAQEYKTFKPSQGLTLRHHVFASNLSESCQVVFG